MPKGRGPTFTDKEVTHLLDAIEVYLPIGSNEWDSVESNRNASFPDKSRSKETFDRNKSLELQIVGQVV